MASTRKSMSPESVVRAGPDQVACRVEDGTVLLQTEESAYYGLNDVGAHVWNAIQEPRPVAELVTHVCETYDVDRERAQADVLALLTELAERDLIEVVAPARAERPA